MEKLPMVLYCLFIAGLLMLLFRGRVGHPWEVILSWKVTISLTVFSIITISWWLGGVPRYLVPLDFFNSEEPHFLSSRPFEVIFFLVSCLVLFSALYELDENAKRADENNPQKTPEESFSERESS